MSDAYQEFDDDQSMAGQISKAFRASDASRSSNPVTDFVAGEGSMPAEDDMSVDVEDEKAGKCKIKFGSAAQIALAATLAVCLGLIIHWIDPKIKSDSRFLRVLGFPGELWMRALKCLVVPLIMSNMICGIATLKSLPGSPKLGAFAITYYMITTIFAATSSIVWVLLLLRPFVSSTSEGSDVDISTTEKCEMQDDTTKVVTAVTMTCSAIAEVDVFDTVLNIFYGLVPDNIIVSMYELNLTGLIMAAVCVGLLIETTNEHGERSQLLNLTEEVNVIIFKLIHFFILLAPIGVFSLLAPNAATFDIAGSAKSVGLLITAVLLGHLLHACIFYPLMYSLLTLRQPFTFMLNLMPAQLTALGTASSAATLPVSLDCAVRKNKIDPNIAKFILSLGATINMDGTAIYFPCAACFVAYAQGLTVTFSQLIVIVITSTLASIGAAPIPSSGLVMLIMIMESANIPVTKTFGLVLAIDWFIDRMATCVNVTGDGFAAGILDAWFHKSSKSVLPAEDAEEADDMFRRVSVADALPGRRGSLIPLGEGSGPAIEPERDTPGRASVISRRRSRAGTLGSIAERKSVTEMAPMYTT